MESFEGAEKSCAVCDSTGKFTCGSCKNIHYCSRTHQKQNWKVHKETCTAFKSTIDLENGKEHLIATRDLEPGIIVLEEPVAFYSPLWWYLPLKVDGVLHEDEDPDLKRLCTTCGKLLQLPEKDDVPVEDRLHNTSCTKCTWPVCSVACQNNPMHAENECKLFAEYEVPFPPIKRNLSERSQALPLPPIMLAITDLVGVLRGMYLKRKDPKLFSNFEALLQDHTVAYHIDNIIKTSTSVLLFVMLIIHKEQRSSPDTVLPILPFLKDGEEDYLKICAIMHLKQFVVTKLHHMWGDPCQKSASYMYWKASLLSHSCVPNCYWTIGPPPDYRIRIRTTVQVKKGDRLTVSCPITPGSLNNPTGSRQKILKQHGVVCKCDRCMDPSELGLFYSAIECPLCKIGKQISNSNNLSYLLPVSPLLGYETLWKCNTEGCGYTIEGAEYEKTIQVISNELKESDKRCQEKHSVSQEDKTDAGILYWDEVGTEAIKIGEKYGLHPNHSIIHNKVNACAVAPFAIHEFHAQLPEVLQRRMQRVLYCLAIEDKIGPGLSPQRARLHVVIVNLLSPVLVSRRWVQGISPEEVRSYHKLLKKSSAEAFKFYSGEFFETGETMNVQAAFVSGVAAAIEKEQLPWLK